MARNISIAEGQSLSGIADILEAEGLLDNKTYFKTLAFLLGKETDLRAGAYVVSDKSSVYALVRTFAGNSHDDVIITIPEGFSMRDVEARLKERTGVQYLLSGFRIKDFKEQYAFLVDAPDARTLEGYIFPDTYHFKPGFAPEAVIEKALQNFDSKVTLELRDEARAQDKSLFEVVVMASLIEKEIPDPDERRVVSGLLWKRLDAGVALQVDATVAFVLNKTRLSRDDLQTPSPYNTYLHRGLPPGPIANPSLDAIEAALHPIESPYWYYLSKPTGETVFSKTLDEHNEARARYLR